MVKKVGRKAELRRLAAKRGWYDGKEGQEARPPVKTVGRPFANGVDEKPCSLDEERAYWEGYDQGRVAEPSSTNPYVASR